MQTVADAAAVGGVQELKASVGTFLMALLGLNSMDVNARAVARRGQGTRGTPRSRCRA